MEQLGKVKVKVNLVEASPKAKVVELMKHLKAAQKLEEQQVVESIEVEEKIQ